jgi:hypothetical protein
LDRNYLHHRRGDANNAILAAVGVAEDFIGFILLGIVAPPQSASA